ncbi:PepSY domain-containing protein [Bauldia litoralis]|uniref:Peptidase propeptide and YPEB domain-containing protein n=1 Tax=Bauldia litoralis TaxID=665467 RepID=A0A1G6CFL1_9HYPH|nr:PepSY domain-containing protein [Bauldia litoralis]SDB31670.1 Peptidase propeptide and YPEB domain-containing protein [Bauldia litoralis]
MIRKSLPALLLGMTLLLAGATAPVDEAEAANCLSDRDARSAVQSGQAVSLSKMIKRIQSTTGGEIVPPPKLCKQGGQLVYIVNVLSPDGKVTKVTVDAASGSILGY